MLPDWLKRLRRQVDESKRPPQDPGDVPPKEEPPAMRDHLPWILHPWTGEIERERTQGPTMDIDAARAYLRDVIGEYLSVQAPNHGLLIRAAPGLGKTTLGVWAAEEWIKQNEHNRLLYAGPRHAFFADLMATMSLNHPDWWYEWLPRQLEDKDSDKCQTCAYAPQINTWLSRGFKGRDFCEQVCGWPYHDNECVYVRQKKRPEPIIFGMHQHVTLGHPLEFNLLIGDESPIQAFTHDWQIPARWVSPPGMDLEAPITHMLALLTVVAGQAEGKPICGPELLNLLGGPDKVIEATHDYLDNELQPTPRIANAEDVPEKTPYRHAETTTRLLYREAMLAKAGRSYVWRVGAQAGHLHLYLRRPVNEHLPRHMIWLDATANVELYNACFATPDWHWRVIEPQLRMRGRFFQVHDRSNTKGSLVKNDEETGEPIPMVRVEQAARLMDKIIEDKCYEAPAVIAPQDVFKVSQRLSKLDHGHFFAARGTNAHEDCDALFVLGVSMPPTTQVERAAAMIYQERDEAFPDQWHAVLKPYNWRDDDGNAWAFPTQGYWACRELQAVLESLREAELVQAAHRARPLHRDIDVWLLNNLPTIGLPLTRLYSMRELLEAPDGVNVFKWDAAYLAACRIDEERGVVTVRDLVAACGLSPETARAYLRKLENEYGWETEAVRSGSRGPTTRGCKRKTAQKAYMIYI